MAASSSSPLSMAASSSSLCNFKKFSNLFFPTSHFPPSSKPKISLKLKTLLHPTSLHFSLTHFAHFRRLSSSFETFHFSEDENQDVLEAETEPDTETEPETESESEPETESKVAEASEEGRLYVGNLPYSMTSSQLAEVFEEAGRVISAEIVYDRVTDRSRGFGFVMMESVEKAKEAIRLFDGSQIGGRTVKVNFPEVPRGGERAVMGPRIRSSNQSFVDSPYKIYAGNLGWGLTSQGLRDAFANQPGLLSAKVIYERDTGRSRGFGFISFETAEDVESALNTMNGVEVEGRPLRLNVAAEKASAPSVQASDRNTESSLDSSDLFSSIST
ncbi:33 kDa ribonucleoprotein, chloroplastic [Pistacia vera]|uniref:33 kDa ribonucleoprotein, chloroplastic n=1 Tax=Pistacia vera TaxID=55513 RepID=UPI00126367D8|nr:33 kDa ribonucleoprotein, chloroplastic [Pistacia vera]